MSLNWKGDDIKKKARLASESGINIVMAAAVRFAKEHHPGWKNRTGTAEGSIRILEFAKQQGKAVVGLWGSRNVIYFIFLELKHGSALRMSASVNYPNLRKEISRAFRGL